MESATFRQWLAQHGCSFEQHEEKRHGGHAMVTVRRGSRRSALPLIGTKKRLDPAVIAQVRKDLGLEDVELPGRPA